MGQISTDVDTDGSVLYTAADIRAGQQVFLRYGLMDNGSIWGHGTLLGPDFSAEYLHTLALHSAASVAQQRYHRPPGQLAPGELAVVEAEVRTTLKNSHYDPRSKTLAVDVAYAEWFRLQPSVGDILLRSGKNRGTHGQGDERSWRTASAKRICGVGGMGIGR